MIIRYTENGVRYQYKTKTKKCITNIHPICISSDSNLPECLCWCAECREQREAK
jgi:hypothetical protein